MTEGFVLALQRGRWQAARRFLAEDFCLGEHAYVTCLTEFLMRGAVHSTPLPKTAVAVLTWLFEHGSQRGYLTDGLADRVVCLAHPDGAALPEARRLFREECVRVTVDALVPVCFEARALGLLFLRELGRGTRFDKRLTWTRCTDEDPFGLG